VALRVSVTLRQFTADPEVMLGSARRAEQLGFDGVFVFDHFFPLAGKDRPIFEGLTALAAVAAVTERIRVGSLVLRAPARPAWTTAHAAWTVQAISRGRLVLGLGVSDRLSQEEFESYGLRFGTAAERVETLRRTLEALDAPELALPQVPVPEVWIGGRSDELRRLAAARASGWNQWGGSPEELSRGAREVRKAADRPISISWGGRVAMGPGVPGELRPYVAAGADELVLTLVGERSMERFAEEVLPGLRDTRTQP
jgi:alkanesulfonate monooxygenase SsuD/methylene tetrahydromethanopterin reductase-like flavin-dependent oxidoreductase (luciferase family)